jgi:hypothetical protein
LLLLHICRSRCRRGHNTGINVPCGPCPCLLLELIISLAAASLGLASAALVIIPGGLASAARRVHISAAAFEILIFSWHCELLLS